MAINKAMRSVLKALSYNEIEVESSRQIANLKRLGTPRALHNMMDTTVADGDYQVPVRVYFPGETIETEDDTGLAKMPAFLYLHGGGWVTDSIDNYVRICARLAKETEHIVIAVGYRLAPEHPFPTGLDDCYAVAKAIYENRFLVKIDPAKLTLIGDSAGGNLAAALSLMARDKREFMPKRQILIYPAVNSDYSDNTPYKSVIENGQDYLLTQGKLEDYIDLYARDEEDKKNPYFAPILAEDLSHQPRTLVITAEFDPLRDEGEDYAHKLIAAGGEVEAYRLRDALHGFFGLGIKYFHVKESFDLIRHFLEKSGEDNGKQEG